MKYALLVEQYSIDALFSSFIKLYTDKQKQTFTLSSFDSNFEG